MKFATEVLSPQRWKDMENLIAHSANGSRLFARPGMSDEARKKLRAGILAGEIVGVIAYAEGRPVGWCSFDRRDPGEIRLMPRASHLGVIPRFYVSAEFQDGGVARLLVAASLKLMGRGSREFRRARRRAPMPRLLGLLGEGWRPASLLTSGP